MTPKEREILNEIKKYPSISQDALADRLQISRSTVASHIKSLSDKGYILGRQYIIRENSYICVIGAANVDLIGYPSNNFIKKDSNPGKIYETSGGVGRNICENLSRLNLQTSFISIFGKDIRGKSLLDELEALGIDTKSSFILDGEPTSIYMAILDKNKDMYIAINQMDIMEKLTPTLLSTKKSFIESSELTVLDTNISKESMEYILNSINQKFFVDAVSVEKCKKINNLLNKIYFLKANKFEAEALSKMIIDDLESCKIAATKLINEGLHSICITLGEKGLLYAEKDKIIYKKAEKVDIKNATGAGDAFMASYIYAFLQDYDIDKRLEFSNAASRLTLMSENSISENFKVNYIEEEMKNVR